MILRGPVDSDWAPLPLTSKALRTAPAARAQPGALTVERPDVLPSEAVQIRQIRTPEVFDEAAERTLGEVADLVRECAEQATGIVFGRVPVEFPVTVAVVESYDQAK